jgi:hypothetical protein
MWPHINVMMGDVNIELSKADRACHNEAPGHKPTPSPLGLGPPRMQSEWQQIGDH